MQKVYFLLLLCSSWSLLAQEQASSLIFVVDQSGAPLIGANVACYEKGQFLVGNTTDLEGAAELALAGDEVEISYLGYETLVINPTALASEGIAILAPNALNLETVVVQAFTVERHSNCCHFCCCGSVEQVLEIHRAEAPAEPEAPLEVKIYPNPSPDMVFIESPDLEGAVQLFALNGHLIEEEICQNGQVQFDLTNLAAGLYLVVGQNEVLGKVQRASRGSGSPSSTILPNPYSIQN